MQSVLLKWKIMLLLYCSMLLLCLSANAENIAICRESGENVTLKCSSARCLSNIKDYVGMYLYKRFHEQEEVLYYHSYGQSKDKITERERYKGRIQTKGSLENHNITISKLTTHDSGFYSCVYKKFPEGETQCNVYTVVVKGVAPSHTPDKAAEQNQQCPFLMLILTTWTISTSVTIMFAVLIVQGVKRRTCSRQTRSTLQTSNDYVYEVMTKNQVRSPAAPEQSLPSPYNFA